MYRNMSGIEQKSSGDANASANKCKAITMETKVKIIKRPEAGKKVNIACLYNMNRSIIDMILKNKKIMEHVNSLVSMQYIIMNANCGKAMEELEKLLAI